MTEFEKFIKDKKEEAEKKQAGFNPEDRIQFFQKIVADFFDSVINDWLGDVKDDLSFKQLPLSITEQSLGTYQVNALVISFGNEEVILRPVGTVLIGAKGRIDMICKNYSVMCVYVGENIRSASQLIRIRINGEVERAAKPGDPVWKFASREGKYSYETITKETFQRKLMELVNAKN